MRRKIVVVTVFAVLLAFTTVSYSADGPYISGNIGVAYLTDADLTDDIFLPGLVITYAYDSGLTYGVAGGMDSGNMRLEVEGFYQKNDIDTLTLTGLPPAPVTGDTSLLAFLVNGFYDFENDSAFTPFVGGGIGYGIASQTLAGVDFDAVVFVYQVGGGVGFAVSDTVSLDAVYRYIGTTTIEFDATSEFEYGSHNLLAGVRIYFN